MKMMKMQDYEKLATSVEQVSMIIEELQKQFPDSYSLEQLSMMMFDGLQDVYCELVDIE